MLCHVWAMRNIPRGLLALLVVWVVAAGVIWLVRSARPTPEKLQAYLAANPLAESPASGRAKIIERTAGQLNRLSFEQRQQFRETGAVRAFFGQLTPAERSRFLDLTLPEGFRQLMTALNKMSPDKRKKVVERILESLRKDSPQAAERIQDADAQKIISQGLSSFYEEADAGVKLDFAPVIEELQRATQGQ